MPPEPAWHIAVLEDDPAQTDLLRLWLGEAGLPCHTYAHGADFIRSLAHHRFDLLLLDWELPDMSGPDVMHHLASILHHRPAAGRDTTPNTQAGRDARNLEPAASLAVIFTTARDSEEDMAAMLRGGADDYLVKPLKRLELLARIEAVMRRRHGGNRTPATRFSLGEFTIDRAHRTLLRHGAAVTLTRRDFELAAFVLGHPGELLSRTLILERVWGHSAALNTRTLDTHVSRLRSKLELSGNSPWRLNAIYQQGYRLEPVAAASAPVEERRPGRSHKPG